MTVTKVICDVPHNTPVAGVTIRYDFTRESEPTGELCWESKTIDLCFGCVVQRFQMFLQAHPESPARCMKEEFSRWAAEIKRGAGK